MDPVTTSQTGNDQAAALRELVSGKADPAAVQMISGVRSISVLSGKGGVGKSNLAVNTSIALAEMGFRVAVLDADLGLASIDILFGVMPKYNLSHVFKGEKELSEIMFEAGENVYLIPGGAGLQELADLDEQRQQWMIGRLGLLEDDIDILVLDAGAGMHKNVMSFALSTDMSILVTTPEPTAIRDAYSIIKSLCHMTDGAVEIGLVVNMAADTREGAQVAERIMSAADQFLRYKVDYLGCVPWDPKIRDAVRRRRPLLLDDGDAPSAKSFRSIAARIADEETAPEPHEEGSFLHRLMRHMKKRRSA